VLAALGEYLQHQRAAQLLNYLLANDVEVAKRVETWSVACKVDFWLLSESISSETYFSKYKVRSSWQSSGLTPTLTSDIALVLPVVDLLIGRCIEEGDIYTLQNVIARFGPLYRSHPTPLSFVRNTLRYYYSSPVIFNDLNVRLMISEGILGPLLLLFIKVN